MHYELPELDHYSYKPVGYCIYCGASDNLTDEHIVPYGLGGNLELPDASCLNCAKITSKFELSVQRGSFWPARIFRDLQSRRKHKKASKSYPLTIVRNNQKEIIEVPLENYPIILPFPLFSVPGYLSQEKNRNGITLEGVASISFGSSPEEVLKTHKADRILVQTAGDKPTDFARMVAKIAFSMAVATGALNEIKNARSFVVPAILGESDNIGQWVGTITEPIVSNKNHLHRVLIIPDREKGLLIGDVQIFSDSETPRYGVILGELRGCE